MVDENWESSSFSQCPVLATGKRGFGVIYKKRRVREDLGSGWKDQLSSQKGDNKYCPPSLEGGGPRSGGGCK